LAGIANVEEVVLSQTVANRQRLAAILVADAAGYSRLMSVDEGATVAALDVARAAFSACVAAQNGRVVDMAGDSVLAVFETATGAVRAALGVQQELEATAASLPEERRMRFRIGVHLGDVIEKDDGTVYGDGVNIAARLEALAEPGGITVSDALRGAVGTRLSVRFDDHGEHHVKNIVRPVHVYRVSLSKQAPSAAPTTPLQQRATRRWLIAGIAAVGVLGGIAVLASRFLTPTVSPSPPPFSIALLPLSAPSDAPADQQLAEGLTQDLTTALGRWRFSHVASRGLVASYKGKVVDPRAAGRELNVRHLVEGEVGRSGDKTLVTLRVVDTASGAQAWSDRMEFEPSLLAAEPMALVMRTSTHLRSGIYDDEKRRAVKDPNRTSALNLVLRGDAAWNGGSEDLSGLIEARRLYDEALRLDPNFVPALLGRGDTLHWELYENLGADRTRLLADMDALSRRAVALDEQSPNAWETRADVLIWLGRWDEALAAAAKAQTVDPARSNNLFDLAWLAYATGRPAEAIAFTERVIAIDPTGDQLQQAMNMCRGRLVLGRYADAEPACEKAAALDNTTWHNQLLLLAACAQNGDMQKAAVARAELLRRQPAFSIAKDKAAPLSHHPEYLKMLDTHYYPGLRKAGIPEQ
jgi:adenylate cyclase